MYRTPAIYLDAPRDFERERLHFEELVSKFCEDASMARGVLYVPVYLSPDAIGECRHYVLLASEGCDGENRDSAYRLALELMKDPASPMTTVTRLDAESWRTPREFEETMNRLLRGWLAEMPEEAPVAASEEPDQTPQSAVPEEAVAVPHVESAVSESDICVACGFCCDGTMFQDAPFRPEESPRFFIDIGLMPIVNHTAEITGFALPCPQFKGKCSVYELGRPSVCSTYRCRLLRSVEAGHHTADEALAIVAEAKALRDALPADIAEMMSEVYPDYVGVTVVSHGNCLKQMLRDPDEGAFREKYAKTAEPIIRLTDYLNSYFLPGA